MRAADMVHGLLVSVMLRVIVPAVWSALDLRSGVRPSINCQRQSLRLALPVATVLVHRMEPRGGATDELQILWHYVVNFCRVEDAERSGR